MERDESIAATLSMATISTLVQARPYRELVYREKQLHVGRASRVKREEPGEHVPYARELTKSEAPLRGRSTHRQISGFAVVVPKVAFRSDIVRHRRRQDPQATQLPLH